MVGDAGIPHYTTEVSTPYLLTYNQYTYLLSQDDWNGGFFIP